MKSILWIIPLTLLGGCTAIDKGNHPEQPSFATVQPSIINNISDVQYQTLNLGSEKKLTRTINEAMQRMTLYGGVTPVIGYQLPEEAPYTVEIASLVSRTMNNGSVFYPEVLILDEKYQTVNRLTAEEMTYHPRHFLSPENISTTLQVNPGDSAQYLLVYTTDQLRQEKTPLFNEAKAYAEARGQVPPPVADIEAIHTNHGELQIKLTPITPETVRARQSMEVDSKLRMVPTAAHKAIKSDRNVEVMIDEAIRHIQSELEKGNTAQAMQLRQETLTTASQAEQTFINTYGQDKTTLKLPASPADNASAAEKVRHYFNFGIINALMSGDTSRALLLVDEARRFANEMDRAF
ncbi:MalM family protein [Endozoicomonas elysicola]|uniref:MalM family protein n=1 Tax=Endozoicomonas elysicola TaxID=305900 RepID=UPI0012FAB392|nr:MalM family protein [Endozoicomonas elysicola]